MIALIIVSILSLGINIYQAIKLTKSKEIRDYLSAEVVEERTYNELSKKVISNLTKKLQETTEVKVGTVEEKESEISTLKAKKSRTKK